MAKTLCAIFANPDENRRELEYDAAQQEVMQNTRMHNDRNYRRYSPWRGRKVTPPNYPEER